LGASADAESAYNIGLRLCGEAEARKDPSRTIQVAQFHTKVGEIFIRKGRFRRATESFRRAAESFHRARHQRGAKKSDLEYYTAQWAQNSERLEKLEGHLSSLLRGQKQSADAADAIALAWLCQVHKQMPATALRFYTEAFAADPKVADDLNLQHRFKAACCATLVGCGQGEDTDKLDTKERGRLRHQALDWLRADLKAYKQAMEQSADKAGPEIAVQMQGWLHDKHFAGVRGNESLAKLPEAERQQWGKLWEEVETLRQRGAIPVAEALRQHAAQRPAPASSARP
jgi:serine/threonine-protein kinase